MLGSVWQHGLARPWLAPASTTPKKTGEDFMGDDTSEAGTAQRPRH
jgi:hypothetical protein